MAAECANFRTALAWYTEQLSRRRRLPARDVRRQISWIDDFRTCLPRRTSPIDVSVRDIVLYFADHCDAFDDPVEWFHRYKAIESFYEEMTREFNLPSNQIRGLYDESDLDPELLTHMPTRPSFAPVDWSREERYAY